MGRICEKKELEVNGARRGTGKENTSDVVPRPIQKQEKASPVIFNDEEYRVRRQEYNPGVDSIPSDFFAIWPDGTRNTFE